jgi:two-component system, OmpR family, phosphate regulon sensor histidine kinase PhoR
VGGAALAEAWLVAALAAAGLAGGALAGSVRGGAALAALAYLGWHLFGLVRLLRALADDAETPQSSGLWGEAFERLYRARRESAARTRHLAQIVQRFEESAAALPDAAVALDGEHLVQWGNDAAQRLLGLRLPRDRGQRITNVVRHPAFVAYLGAPREAPGGVEFPAPASAERTLLAQLVAYGENRRLLVVRDVTEVRRIEQVRRDFVANASHELRTPLTVIYGFVETLHAERDALPGRWARPVELMRAQAVRMQRIVDDMLVLARLESTPVRADAQQEVDVAHLLEVIRGEALALAGSRGHRIALAADAGLRLVGNEAELRSAFANLVFNAVQHTPDGTGIELAWSRGADGAARFVVQDRGEGIAPEHIPRLTERFYRVETGRSRARGGTGLGLAIVKHALQRHGGELVIESAPGAGARFSCVFPAASAREHVGAVARQQA